MSKNNTNKIASFTKYKKNSKEDKPFIDVFSYDEHKNNLLY